MDISEKIKQIDEQMNYIMGLQPVVSQMNSVFEKRTRRSDESLIYLLQKDHFLVTNLKIEKADLLLHQISLKVSSISSDFNSKLEQAEIELALIDEKLVLVETLLKSGNEDFTEAIRSSGGIVDGAIRAFYLPYLDYLKKKNQELLETKQLYKTIQEVETIIIAEGEYHA